MNSSLAIKYTATNGIKILILSAGLCCLLGLFFIVLDVLNYSTFKQQDALLGGAILTVLGLVGLKFGFSLNLTISIDSKGIRFEKSKFKGKDMIEIPFSNISEINWSSISGSIQIKTSQGKEFKITPNIYRAEGRLTDRRDLPEAPGGGPTLETFNLMNELRVRMENARSN